MTMAQFPFGSKSRPGRDDDAQLARTRRVSVHGAFYHRPEEREYDFERTIQHP